jgi:hypothetical protein
LVAVMVLRVASVRGAISVVFFQSFGDGCNQFIRGATAVFVVIAVEVSLGLFWMQYL